MFLPLQKYLPRAATKYGIGKEFEAANITHQCLKIILGNFEGMPPEELSLIKASYRDKNITISVPTSGWAQEVNIRKEKIKDQINKNLGSNTVDKITVRLKIPNNDHSKPPEEAL